MKEQTALFLIPAMAFIFASVFVVLWWRARHQKYILGFAVGYGASGLGFLLANVGHVPGITAWDVFRHTVPTISVLGLVWGAVRMAGLRFHYGISLFISVCGITTSMLAANSQDAVAQMYAAHMHFALLYALTAVTLAGTPSEGPLGRVIAWLFGLAAAQFFLRPLVALLFLGDLTPEAVKETPLFVVQILLLTAVSLFTALTLIAAVLLDELRDAKRRAEMDDLSGLPGRRAFETAAFELLERSEAERRPLCMIVADVDHLAHINEVLGCQFGDEAIATLGGLIDRTIRDHDLAGRIGGERMAIVAWNCELHAARGLAERLRKAFAAIPQDSDIGTMAWTASFGVAELRSGESYEALIARANTALMQAKAGGRNRVTIDGGKSSASRAHLLPPFDQALAS